VVHTLSTRQASSLVYSYGFERVSTLFWFSNAILLLFEAMFSLEGIAEGLFLEVELEAS
jgi:Co/Zn/Cd efflux system component